MNGYLRRLSEITIPRKKIGNSVSLFCGGGGLDLGLEYAGFRCLFATDVEASYCETIEANLKTTVEPRDIQYLSGKYILSKIGCREIDLVAGGPPCQDFSILGRRTSIRDPRGKLVFEYVRLIRELNPSVFIFENVPGILTVNNGKDWSRVLLFFKEETGYNLHWKMLNAAEYGIPQIRKRIFLVGIKRKKSGFAFPAPTHFEPREYDLFAKFQRQWLPAKLAFKKVARLPNHDIRPHGDRVRSRYERVPQGGRDRTDHTDRVHPDRPSGTVLVGSAAGGGRPFIHPYLPRHITVREAARLQSFPDWYVFKGSSTHQYRQVGNAVPPLLAYELGKNLAAALRKAAPS